MEMGPFEHFKHWSLYKVSLLCYSVTLFVPKAAARSSLCNLQMESMAAARTRMPADESPMYMNASPAISIP